MKNAKYVLALLLFITALRAFSQGVILLPQTSAKTDVSPSPPLPPVINIAVSGKVYLQGAYNTQTGMMNNKLNTLGILQTYATNQPYNVPEFENYDGTEKVPGGFFSMHPEIIDWVLITVRHRDLPAMTLRRAAFVRQDGVLVEIDGVSTQIQFNEIAGGNYYVSVQHRNHLGIRSLSLVDFSTGTGGYDFTTSAEQAYQNQSYTSTVQLGTAWAMRGGNANANNTVKYNGPDNDQDKLQNAVLGGSASMVLNNRYSTADLNMDGTIKTNGPGNDQNFLLNYALNGLLGCVYVEQL